VYAADATIDREVLTSRPTALAPTSGPPSAQDGLEPSNYITPAIQVLFLAKDEVRLASGLASGRTVPSEVETFVHPHDIDPALVIRDVATASDVQTVPNKITPQTDAYSNLKIALARYREIKQLGGWTVFSNGKILRPGMRGPGIAELRGILAERSEDIDAGLCHQRFPIPPWLDARQCV
jgi:hypothetical protein